MKLSHIRSPGRKDLQNRSAHLARDERPEMADSDAWSSGTPKEGPVSRAYGETDSNADRLCWASQLAALPSETLSSTQETPRSDSRELRSVRSQDPPDEVVQISLNSPRKRSRRHVDDSYAHQPTTTLCSHLTPSAADTHVERLLRTEVKELNASGQSGLEWSPKLILPTPYGIEVALELERVQSKPKGTTFCLEPFYKVTRVLPRSHVDTLKSMRGDIMRTFLFRNPIAGVDVSTLTGEGRRVAEFWRMIIGEKKSLVWEISDKEGNSWELYVKPDETLNKRGEPPKLKNIRLEGYLQRQFTLRSLLSSKVQDLISKRKLPLVLDIDDTLLRIVGSNSAKYIPTERLAEVDPSRILTLRDGRQAVMATGLLQFLDEMKMRYEISICSVGDVDYVEQVREALEMIRPNGEPRFMGVVYSARDDWLYFQGRTAEKLAERAAKLCRKPDGFNKELPEVDKLTTESDSKELKQVEKNVNPFEIPPKDLRNVFAYYDIALQDSQFVLEDTSIRPIFVLDPLIVDDCPAAWNREQQANVVQAKMKKENVEKNLVWDVVLDKTIPQALHYSAAYFWPAYDAWVAQMAEYEADPFCALEPPRPPRLVHFLGDYMRACQAVRVENNL
ncbi:hypothetical protein HDU85_006570 [Gaertneriomyces sp. JEL0708]|nr:hypothetical protein HDU85_006570 [Gaertneriomyces sp. JEL0708]